MRRISIILIAVVVLVNLGIGLAVFFWPGSVKSLLNGTGWAQVEDQFAQCRATSVAGGAAAIGGPFSLTDHTGKRVTDVEVIDRPTLLYFGYTYCPDVCPLDTYRNAEAVSLLAERGVEVKPVMITIDPTRDTPEAMRAFVEYLHEDMVGLTGTEAEIKAAIKAYRVYAARNGEGENYLMDHSTFTYLMAPEHGFLEYFNRDATPEDMADSVACFVDKL
ncbi:MAG: SCO family protein [Paracoccaceae bacterium]